MPFIPHTDQDIQEMLKAIGIESIEELFDEIPENLISASLGKVPAGLSEMELTRLMQERAQQDSNLLCFIGAGAYEHHIPAAVWEIASRGEFMTAYTPYQAEASQGSLQLIYEYQTMIAGLMGMEVANASLYDGASALSEAILMAVRLNKKSKCSVLMPRTLHPYYRQAVTTIVSQQGIELIDLPYHKEEGRIDISTLDNYLKEGVAALVIPQPNFFGLLEEVDALTDWAKRHGILNIAVVNPLAMALLKPPGKWGQFGVDIACGEGQPLGIPLASGGPYYGFLCSRRTHVRQMPGRIVGRTVDQEGKDGFVLTLQAREQHIRRAKATSNICTNQGLMVTASAIYMALMGPRGLRQTAAVCHQRCRELAAALTSIPGVRTIFNAPFFNEIALELPKPAELVLQELAAAGIQGGYPLQQTYPELVNCLLVCATETKMKRDIALFAQHLQAILGGKKLACLG